MQIKNTSSKQLQLEWESPASDVQRYQILNLTRSEEAEAQCAEVSPLRDIMVSHVMGINFQMPFHVL